MKKALLLIFLLSCSFFSKSESSTFVYEEKTDNESITTTYQVSEQEGKRIIQSVSPKEDFCMIFSSNYLLEKFSFTSKENNNRYEIFLNGSVLSIDGMFNGQRKNKQFSIQGKPWIQNFAFGLIPFAASSQISQTFFIVDTKNVTLYQMRAKKMETSTLTLHNKPYKAQRIEIRLTGFKSHFWKAEIWFDVDTHQMVLYQTNEGPNTPLTTLEFIK